MLPRLYSPADNTHRCKVNRSMLGHSRRRWTNIETTLHLYILIYISEIHIILIIYFLLRQINLSVILEALLGGGPRVVVSTAAFQVGVRGFVSRSRRFERNKNVSSPSTLAKTQYCGEPPWPRGRVLGLRPPGFEFQILCLEGSVISIISPSSGGSLGPA